MLTEKTGFSRVENVIKYKETDTLSDRGVREKYMFKGERAIFSSFSDRMFPDVEKKTCANKVILMHCWENWKDAVVVGENSCFRNHQLTCEFSNFYSNHNLSFSNNFNGQYKNMSTVDEFVLFF